VEPLLVEVQVSDTNVAPVGLVAFPDARKRT